MTKWRNVAERAMWTFVQGFTGAMVLSDWFHIGPFKAAVMGGVAALLSFLKTVSQERLAALRA